MEKFGGNMAKVLKSQVEYTDHAMRKNERCELCKYFMPFAEFKTNLCQKVNGSIAAAGWCKLFKRK